MPSKKKKYNARFPAGRIKKIMQTDEEVGKVAQAVPVIISKALEMFIESLLKKSMHITQGRNAKTLTPSHMKQCILSESRFDFLKDLVKNVPDASIQEDNENNALAESNVNFGIIQDQEVGAPVEARPSPRERRKDSSTSSKNHPEQTSSRPSSSSRTPVIQFGPKVSGQDNPKLNFSVSSIIGNQDTPSISQTPSETEESKLRVTIASQEVSRTPPTVNNMVPKEAPLEILPSLVPLSSSIFGQSGTGDNLCIDEDYDN